MSLPPNKQFLKEGSILFISTLIVNAGNYVTNLLLGRWLGPSTFSEVSLLITLLLMISFVALAFQLTAAKYVAELYSENRAVEVVTLLKWLQKWATIVGILLAILMVIFSMFWQDFFQTNSTTPFLIFALALPLYLLMSLNRGVLQGQAAYRHLAITYQAEMWSRLGLSIAFVWFGFGVNGVALALTLSLAFTLWVSRVQLKENPIHAFDYKKVIHFLLIILLYECSQILINNSDTVLVKHYFPPIQAGLYAALALIGRIVYFGTWTVVTILFPTVIRLEKEGKKHLKYFLGGLFIVTTIAGLIIFTTYLFPDEIVKILFGEKYLSIAPLLWQYALATGLFACGNVFVYYHLSLDRRIPVWITLVGGLLQIVLIIMFHKDFEQVIRVQIGLMLSLLLTLIAYQLYESQKNIFKMKKSIIILFLIVLTKNSFSQDELKPGFAMLEKGAFAEGADFFKHYLVTRDSTNKTALLCYGRGTGLAGNTKEAKQIFEKLLRKNPNDFEVSLNAAEAYMWGKEYDQAKNYYEKLLAKKPNDFVATLGYANALASVGDYKNALRYSNYALKIQPDNQGAKVSRKYANLAVADQYSKNQEYSQALSLLENIFKDFKNDQDALFAKAQLKIATQKLSDAEVIYKTLLKNSLSHTDAYLGLSYLAFLQKNLKQTLTYADLAINASIEEPEKKLKAQLGKVTAMGWNEQFTEAFNLLAQLDKQYPNSADILLKKASLMIWNKEYAKSVSLFGEALKKVQGSFDGNLGMADALFAQELDDKSREYVQKTLGYYPNQKDANYFLSKIKLRHAPSITTHDFLMSDKGGNSSTNYQLDFGIDLATRVRLLVGYKSRIAENSLENKKARSDFYSLGMRWRIKPMWLMNAKVSQVQLQSQNSNGNSHVLVDFSNEFNLTKQQTLELKYQSDVQNFTAGLIEKNLTFQNLIAVYNLNTAFKVGVYSQYYHTISSDGNVRDLLFASLYYNLKATPVIKFGFNFNTMSFHNQVASDYFSPAKFNSYELFGLVENLQVPNQKLLYQASLAGGFQKIETQSFQSTYRVGLALGYRPFKNLEGYLYTLQSNSATSSVVGYTYSETGIKAKYILMK